MKGLQGFFDQIGFSRRGSSLWRAYWRIMLLGNPAVAIVFNVTLGGVREFLPRWVLSTIIGGTVCTFCFLLIWTVRHAEGAFWRWRGQPAPRHSKFWDMRISLLAMLPGMWFGFQVGGAFNRAIGRKWFTPDFSDYSSGILFGILILLLSTVQEMLKDAKAAAQEKELSIRRLENERLQAQLAALTAQMNPHLLFNALNGVASLIHSDPQRAENAVLQLSDLYRGILESTRKASHSLERELELCRAYLGVEQARFGERLRATIAIDPAVDPARIEVPVLSLQPLVENAVKYAVAPRAAGGTIELKAARIPTGLRIDIVDDGPGFGKSQARQGSGLGISNCRSRLQLQYGDAGKLTIGAPDAGVGTRVSLEVPS